MLRVSAILAVVLIVLCCLLPLAPSVGSVPFTLVVQMLLGMAIAGALLLLFYKLIHVQLTHEIRASIRLEQTQVPLPRQVPAPILHSLSIYNVIAIRNYWFYRILGVISLAASLFLTIAIGQNNNTIPTYVAQLIAYVSALSTGIIFTFNLVEKSNRARKAFRILQNAIMRYRYGELDLPELINKYREAEEYLGEDEFRQPPGSAPK